MIKQIYLILFSCSDNDTLIITGAKNFIQSYGFFVTYFHGEKQNLIEGIIHWHPCIHVQIGRVGVLGRERIRERKGGELVSKDRYN